MTEVLHFPVLLIRQVVLSDQAGTAADVSLQLRLAAGGRETVTTTSRNIKVVRVATVEKRKMEERPVIAVSLNNTRFVCQILPKPWFEILSAVRAR